MILSSLHIEHLKWMNRANLLISFICVSLLPLSNHSIHNPTNKNGRIWDVCNSTPHQQESTPRIKLASICPGPNKWECFYVDGAESFVWQNPFTTASPKTGQYVALIWSWTNCGGLNDTRRLPVGHQFHELHIFMMAQECTQVERRSITTSSWTK